MESEKKMEYELFYWSWLELKDYIFQVVPSNFNKVLKERIHNIITAIYEDLKWNPEVLFEKKFDAVYSFSLGGYLYLIKARPVPDRKDTSSSVIWEFVGIVFKKHDEKLFKTHLAFFFDPRGKIWDQARELSRNSYYQTQISSKISLPNQNDIELTQWDHFMNHLFTLGTSASQAKNDPFFIPFSSEGEFVVKNLLSCKGLPWVNITFGPHSQTFISPIKNSIVQSKINIETLCLSHEIPKDIRQYKREENVEVMDQSELFSDEKFEQSIKDENLEDSGVEGIDSMANGGLFRIGRIFGRKTKKDA